MKITSIYKLNVFLACVCLFSTGAAQEQLNKLTKEFKTEPGVAILINSSYTSILLETWNKNTISLEAFIEADEILEENKERLLKNWKVEIVPTENEITINSMIGDFWSGNISSSDLRNGKRIPQSAQLSPIIKNVLAPILKNIENNPIPNALSRDLASMDFDTEAYQKNENKYIQQWEDQIREKFGNDSENTMRLWVQQLQTQVNKVEQTSNGSFQSLEGKQFARQMQDWASRFSGNIEITEKIGNTVTVYKYHSTKTSNTGAINRVLKIKIPIASKLKLISRHGEVKLEKVINNMTASLSHTSLQAKKLTGLNTLVKVSYAPVSIETWDGGKLSINYVKNCRIQNATDLKVHSESSNLFISNIQNSASIIGSFGTVTVTHLSETFNTLDLAIENSDFKLNLPDAAFNFNYSGTQSRMAIPKSVIINARKNFENIFVNGYQKSRNTDKAITIHAKYSNIDIH